MIEIVYSNDADKRDEYLRLPKNIRQIGAVDEKRKVYIEDYVSTFLSQLANQNTLEYKVVVLLGESLHNNGSEYIFVSGAIYVEEIEVICKNIIFNEKIWTGIYDKIKKYFPLLEIVGWAVIPNEISFIIGKELIKTHIDNFAGKEKILLILEFQEKEENIYYFHNGEMKRYSGYYIYYEKNEVMQEYMISLKEKENREVIEEVNDNATKSFRTIIQEKKEENHQKKVMAFMYTATIFFVMLAFGVGVSMFSNYDKMKSMEQSLNIISQAVKEDSDEWFADSNNAQEQSESEENISSSSQITVESVSGNIEPEEEESAEQKEAEEQKESEKQEESQDNNSEQDASEDENVSESSSDTTTDSSGVVTEISVSEEEMLDTMNDSEGSTDTTTDNSAETSQQETNYYIIKEGDTLQIICNNYYGNQDKLDELCKVNEIDDVDKIYIGQKIILP